MAGLVPAIHVFCLVRRKTWMPGTRPGMTNKWLMHLPARRPEGRAAEHAELHATGHRGAVDRAGEIERQRHRLGDGHFPGDVVAVDAAVENVGRLSLRRLGAFELAAHVLHHERGRPLAHRRVHGEVPGSVYGHDGSLGWLIVGDRVTVQGRPRHRSDYSES